MESANFARDIELKPREVDEMYMGKRRYVVRNTFRSWG